MVTSFIMFLIAGSWRCSCVSSWRQEARRHARQGQRAHAPAGVSTQNGFGGEGNGNGDAVKGVTAARKGSGGP
jgi:hypothetical protein